jgi:hypothetical protein
MDSQKNNLLNQNIHQTIKIKKDSCSQTLISSNHFNSNIIEKNLMSNEDYYNFFFGKNPGYLKLENLDKAFNKNENNNRKKRENSKKKNESIAFQLFQEEFKKSNPNLSEQELKKNSKENWKQMGSSLRNIYFSNVKNMNHLEKEN